MVSNHANPLIAMAVVFLFLTAMMVPASATIAAIGTRNGTQKNDTNAAENASDDAGKFARRGCCYCRRCCFIHGLPLVNDELITLKLKSAHQNEDSAKSSNKDLPLYTTASQQPTTPPHSAPIYSFLLVSPQTRNHRQNPDTCVPGRCPDHQ